MKELYIECNMGVAGDMLCAALLDTLDENDKNIIIEKLNTLLPNVKVSISSNIKCEISGTKFDVEIIKEHQNHASINEIFDTINSFDLPSKVKENAINVYSLIAKAESNVHKKEVAEIHLHEVGAKDAIMDITACCYIIDYIGIEKIICSPIATGYGNVNSAHGILPIPAPATAQLLLGIESYSGDIKGELTTPTGAGLVKYFAKEITSNNTIKSEKIGYGMGTKDFGRANCVRVFIGDSGDESIYELKCQIDDMTGEELGYAINKLMELGALDAFVTPIVMKKSRPAHEFTVIATPETKDELTNQIFKHTTTLGVRQILCKRQVLNREIIEVNGVHIKRSSGFGVKKEKMEFDDLVKIAEKKNISIFEAKKDGHLI